MDRSFLEIILAALTLIGIFLGVGKWIERRESLTKRVVALESQCNGCLVRLDAIYVRKDELNIQLANIKEKQNEMHTDIRVLNETLVKFLQRT